MEKHTCAIHSERHEECLLICFQGYLDLRTAPDVERTIFDFIHNGETRLVLDFEEVKYITSAGLRMLLSLSRKLQSNSGRLILCAMNEKVKKVIELAGLLSLFEVLESRDEALKRLRNPPV